MKAGYKVYNDIICKDDNCILVSNYDYQNCVVNFPLNEKQLVKQKGDIGVWKLKK